MKNRKNINCLLFLFVSLFIFASCNNDPVESTTNNEGIKIQEQTINQDENVQNQNEENQEQENIASNENNETNENNEESSTETQENSQEQIIEAIKKDNIKEVKSLTKNIDIDLRDENNKTLLMYAVENNAFHVDEVDLGNVMFFRDGRKIGDTVCFFRNDVCKIQKVVVGKVGNVRRRFVKS